MTEFLLNTKIVHGSGGNLPPDTGDGSWFIVLLIVAIISGIIFFKKKFVKTLLSFCLAFSFVALVPGKSFADQSVTITSTAEVTEDNPADLTITNNGAYAISIISVEILNQALPEQTTWELDFVQDADDIEEADMKENICFDIAPQTSFTFSVSPNIDEYPEGELCDICFKAVSTHYNATYINIDGDDSVRAQNDFNFSFSTFEDADPTEINREIAIAEAQFACIPNTYNNVILGNTSYDVSDRLAFMRTLGFEDNIYCKLWPEKQADIQADPGVSIYTPTYTLDKNDVTSYCFNHRKINFGNHYTEIINISVGATGGDFEWASNFDFGAETEDYTNATGPHPEWTNKMDHKGFDIAKNRLMQSYNSYYSNYIDNDPDVNKIILINGHSRGGAIANLLGRDFESDPSYRSFTYTFASPNTTTFSSYQDYETIYNIINLDDLVSQFPGYVSGFCKYGKDIDLSVHDDIAIDNTPMSTVFENNSGYGEYNGNSPEEVRNLIYASCDLIEDRDNSYTLNSKYSKQYYKLGLYETRAEALEDVDDFIADLKKYKLDNYAKFNDVVLGWDGYYHIRFTCCAAFIMQDITNWLFIYKDNYDGPFLAYNKELINILLEALGVVPGVVHGHIWMSYNMLAKYDK